MRNHKYRFLIGLMGVLPLLAIMPTQVEGAALFFYNAPRNYTRTYSQSYGQPYAYGRQNSYYSQYSPYADPRVYSDPRSVSRNQASESNPDYYQQYENWWEK